MDESQKHYANRKKSQTTDYIVYDSIYMRKNVFKGKGDKKQMNSCPGFRERINYEGTQENL